MAFLNHIRAGTTLGEVLKILAETFQLVSGLSESVLIDTRNVNYVEAPWIQTTRGFLYMTESTMEVPDLMKVKPHRQQDIAIMDCVPSSDYDVKTQEIINKCRMYLQVTYLLEISNNSETQLLDE